MYGSSHLAHDLYLLSTLVICTSSSLSLHGVPVLVLPLQSPKDLLTLSTVLQREAVASSNPIQGVSNGQWPSLPNSGVHLVPQPSIPEMSRTHHILQLCHLESNPVLYPSDPGKGCQWLQWPVPSPSCLPWCLSAPLCLVGHFLLTVTRAYGELLRYLFWARWIRGTLPSPRSRDNIWIGKLDPEYSMRQRR